MKIVNVEFVHDGGSVRRSRENTQVSEDRRMAPRERRLHAVS